MSEDASWEDLHPEAMPKLPPCPPEQSIDATRWWETKTDADCDWLRALGVTP